jgi:hypothetical protein
MEWWPVWEEHAANHLFYVSYLETPSLVSQLMQCVPFLVLVSLQLKCVLSSASKYTDTKMDLSICSLSLLPTWKTKMFHPFACLWSLMMWGVGNNFDFHVLNKNFLRKNRHSSSMSHKLQEVIGFHLLESEEELYWGHLASYPSLAATLNPLVCKCFCQELCWTHPVFVLELKTSIKKAWIFHYGIEIFYNLCMQN